MNKIPRKTAFLCILLLVFAAVAYNAIRSRYGNADTASVQTREKITQLPEDVENVIKRYRYQEMSDDREVSISGDQIVRRGKKILGLRSNLVKTNFFQGINGTVKSAKRTILFSASDAEWDADSAHPFILKDTVVVTINGTTLHNVRSARLYFKQGLIEVITDHKKVYRL